MKKEEKKAKDSKKVAEKFLRDFDKNCRKEKRKIGGRLATVMIMSMLATGCSLADPAIQGYSTGGDAWEVGIPKKGSVTRSVTISVNPDDSTPAGRMYNTSVYNKFTNWLTKPALKGGK